MRKRVRVEEGRGKRHIKKKRVANVGTGCDWKRVGFITARIATLADRQIAVLYSVDEDASSGEGNVARQTASNPFLRANDNDRKGDGVLEERR